MYKLFLSAATISLLTFIFSQGQVMALSPADFPACSNPQGTQVVNYDSGTHGIIGSQLTYTGSDSVYKIDDVKTMQCFCPSSGNGIQTNWFKANGLSANEIKTYEHEGWIYVPTGKLWGLSDDPYLAKNQDFTCQGSSNNSGGNPGSSQSGGGSANGTTGGIIEASSAVLGLAGTGNTITLLGIFLTGLVAFILSFFLRKSK